MRHIEIRTDFMFINGKRVEFEYHVEIREPTPAPFDYPDGVDAIGCEPTPGTFVPGHGWVAPEPKPKPEIERPSKNDYILAFFADCGTPWCVHETIARVYDLVGDVKGGPMNRRVRKAVRRFDPTYPPAYYDAGTLARINHYHFDSIGRRWAHEHDPETEAMDASEAFATW
jgi:hypothetical protein